MRIEKETFEAIKENAGSLKSAAGLQPERLLMAICLVESSGGFDNHRRVEKAYLPGGRYFNQALHDQYGDDAAASWGPMQVMYVTATELGFKGSPQELGQPAQSVRMAVALLNRRIIKSGGESLEQIADAYNSGTYKDGKVPEAYIAKVKEAYAALLAEGAQAG